MIMRILLLIYLISCVSGFLLEDVKTTASPATMTIQDLAQLLLEEKTVRHHEVSSLTQRVSSLEIALTDLFHKVQHIPGATVTTSSHGQATSVDITTKIVALEKNVTDMQGNIAKCLAVNQKSTTTINELTTTQTGLNSLFTNVSGLVDKLIHTQVNVNDILAHFDRNINNVSITVNSIMLQQNNISSQTSTLASACKTLTSNQSSTNTQLERLNQMVQHSDSLTNKQFVALNQTLEQFNKKQFVMQSSQLSLNNTIQHLVYQQNTLNNTVQVVHAHQNTMTSQQPLLNSTLETLIVQQNITMSILVPLLSSMDYLNKTVAYMSTQIPVLNKTISQVITAQQDDAVFFTGTSHFGRSSLLHVGASNVIIKFDHIQLNVGAVYDNNTGEFHIKTPGIYLLTLTSTLVVHQDLVYCSINYRSSSISNYKEDGTYNVMSNLEPHDEYRTASKSAFVRLDLDDSIYISCLNTNVTALYDTTNLFNYILFSGGLIHK